MHAFYNSLIALGLGCGAGAFGTMGYLSYSSGSRRLAVAAGAVALVCGMGLIAVVSA